MFRVDHCAGLLAVLALTLLAGGCGGDTSSGGGDTEETASGGESSQPTTLTSETPAPQVTTTFASVPAAIEELKISAAASNDDQTRAIGAWLSTQGAAAIDPVVAVMNDASQEDKVRRRACGVLGEFGPAAREELHTAVESENVWVQSMAIETLGKLRPATEESVRVIMTQLDNSDERTVQTAIRALGAIGEDAAIAADQLQEMQNDNSLSDTVRNLAHDSLRRIEPRRDFTGLGTS